MSLPARGGPNSTPDLDCFCSPGPSPSHRDVLQLKQGGGGIAPSNRALDAIRSLEAGISRFKLNEQSDPLEFLAFLLDHLASVRVMEIPNFFAMAGGKDMLSPYFLLVACSGTQNLQDSVDSAILRDEITKVGTGQVRPWSLDFAGPRCFKIETFILFFLNTPTPHISFSIWSSAPGQVLRSAPLLPNSRVSERSFTWSRLV